MRKVRPERPAGRSGYEGGRDCWPWDIQERGGDEMDGVQGGWKDSDASSGDWNEKVSRPK